MATQLFGDVLETIDQARELALRGELRAVAIAALTTDRTIMTTATEGRDHAQLVGAIAMLQHDLISGPNA